MKIRSWHITGVIFTALFGSVLHYAYEWSGFNPIFAVFGSVNESTWEHLKLLYWAYMLFAAAELWTYGKDTMGFFTSKAFGILAGMLFITASFYTYTGVLGRNVSKINLLLFALGSVVSYLVSYHFIKHPSFLARNFDISGFVILTVLACAFCLFTFSPPQIGLFIPPII